MTVNVIRNEKPKQTVKQMTPNTAFKIGGIWYLPIHIEDNCIEDYQSFWELNRETAFCLPSPTKPVDGVPCIRIANARFYYVDADLEVEDYGTPSLSVNIS